MNDLSDQDRLAFSRMALLLEEIAEKDTQVTVQPTDYTDLVNAINGLGPQFTLDDLKAAIAQVFRVPEPPDASREMAAIAEALKMLDHRLKGFGTQAFGASGPSNIASDPNRLIGKVSFEGNAETLTTSIRDYLDTVETKLQTLITETQRRPTYKVANALLSVPAGAGFTTVVETTPAVAVTVQGFGADLNSTAALTYRYRLITGTDATPTVIDMEQISAGDNSKRALLLSVAANTRIAVQVNHGDVVAQDFRATLNWSEEP